MSSSTPRVAPSNADEFFIYLRKHPEESEADLASRPFHLDAALIGYHLGLMVVAVLGLGYTVSIAHEWTLWYRGGVMLGVGLIWNLAKLLIRVALDRRESKHPLDLAWAEGWRSNFENVCSLSWLVFVVNGWEIFAGSPREALSLPQAMALVGGVTGVMLLGSLTLYAFFSVGRARGKALQTLKFLREEEHEFAQRTLAGSGGSD
jgi:hypothetical protein